jgi:hypothetical protein
VAFPLPLGGTKQGLLYLMPWMVVGGADLYDYYILETLRALQLFRVTIVIEQALQWPHPWRVRSRLGHAWTLCNATVCTEIRRARARAGHV